MPDVSPFIGVLMLDTAFPRIPGDAGNLSSYPFPVKRRIVPGAGSTDIVSSNRPDPALVAKFVAAARALEKEGAVGIVSTCGFLIHIQQVLAQAVRIPVMVSALSLHVTLSTALGGRPIGILTASADSLLRGGLQSAGIDPRTVSVAGLQDCAAFAGAILSAKADQPQTLDTDAIKAHCVARTRQMVSDRPDIGAILLECGNLPPYAEAIRTATKRPVFGILDAASLLWSGHSISS